MKVQIIIAILVLVVVSQGADLVCEKCGGCPCCLDFCWFGHCEQCIVTATPGMTPEEACYSNAMQIIDDGCKARCDVDDPGDDCDTCIKEDSALEPTCQAIHALGGSCFSCVGKMRKVWSECKNKPTIAEKVACIIKNAKKLKKCYYCMCSLICKVHKKACAYLHDHNLCPKKEIIEDGSTPAPGSN